MARATLTIDLDAITANWRALARQSGTAEAGAVVKADAYGLGATRVARTIAAAGARRFFVAISEEGAVLRPALGPEAEIFVFSGHMEGDATRIAEHGLIPLLNSLEQVQRHLASLPAHPFGIQLDSGMNRLGLEEADWNAVSGSILSENPVLIMSHLACADEPEHPMNASQLASFRRMTDGTRAPRSLSATGGILLGNDYHFDVTRPGIGLYGGLPFEAARPVVSLSLPVIQVREVQPGETVGYGNTWTARKQARVATLAAGYADGLIRAMTGRAQVFADRTPCPLVGRVSMDLMGVDVSHLKAVPEALDILCPKQGIDALADYAGTIGYEILTALGGRYARRYEGAAA
ncbi:Alanine racemase, biosynthetic [Defluviimonas aquaemixtae]|uniref:Alanine racemase n=1 Tax=Albidovulum aquaemixtae TaxID=1542388 RepID=A0A2R8B463_9RHOB|nr:alanine racemase [Defluviimonas aquaemixtae]SPH17377.1 Alanine racemase, biosynthetic [Defluviimonas aquaemixtae]